LIYSPIFLFLMLDIITHHFLVSTHRRSIIFPCPKILTGKIPNNYLQNYYSTGRQVVTGAGIAQNWTSKENSTWATVALGELIFSATLKSHQPFRN